MKIKKALTLNPADHEVLVTMYLDRRLAIDHYAERPRELRSLTDAFKTLTGRSDAPEDILHYMRTKRKQGKWVKLGNTARKVSKSPEEILALEDSKILEDCYIKIAKKTGKGNDSFAHDPELMRELEREFQKETGRYIHGSQLNAALTRMRKEGNLKTLGPEKYGRPEAFGDMDEAANM